MDNQNILRFSSNLLKNVINSFNLQKDVDNNQLIKEFDKLENFFIKSYALVSPSFDAYRVGNRPKKRLLIIILIKMFGGFISFLRCVIAISFNTPLIAWLTSDAFYIMGNRYIISLIMASGAIGMCIVIGGFTILMDMKSDLVAIEYFHEMKAKIVSGFVSEKYRKKFYRQLRFTTKYISWPLLLFLCMNATMVFSLPPIIAYFMPDTNYSVPNIIFWTICTVVLCYDFYVSLFSMFILIYLCSIFLKYNFDQVNDDIQESFMKNDKIKLKKSIVEHNSLCMTTAKLNILFRKYILILYIICKPGLNSLLFASLSPESNAISRLTTTSMFIITTFLILTINIICSSISCSAHKPIPTLYKISIYMKLPLSLNLKVRGLIDKLSGPKIGIYCSDLYPMTSYELYKDIWSFATIYLLLNTFINALKQN